MAEQTFGDGDVILRAGDADDKQNTQTFRVSSHVLKLASPVLSKMIDSSGWLKPIIKSEVRLPTDSPKVVRIVLNAIHLKDENIPKSLTKEELVELAVFCGKYELVATMRHTVSRLVAEHERSQDVSWAACLLVYYTFGDWDGVRAASKRLLLVMRTNKWGIPLNSNRSRFSPLLPSDLIDTIALTRSMVIDTMLEQCYKKDTSLMRGEGCSHNEAQVACNMMSLGALTRALFEGGLYGPGKSATNVWCSIETFHREITSTHEDESARFLRGKDHHCDVFQGLRPTLDRMMEKLPDPVNLYLNQQRAAAKQTRGDQKKARKGNEYKEEKQKQVTFTEN